MLNLIFIFVTDFSVISFGCFYEVVLLSLLIFKKKTLLIFTFCMTVWLRSMFVCLFANYA